LTYRDNRAIVFSLQEQNMQNWKTDTGDKHRWLP